VAIQDRLELLFELEQVRALGNRGPLPIHDRDLAPLAWCEWQRVEKIAEGVAVGAPDLPHVQHVSERELDRLVDGGRVVPGDRVAGVELGAADGVAQTRLDDRLRVRDLGQPGSTADRGERRWPVRTDEALC